jgi:phosphate transport system permease protein
MGGLATAAALLAVGLLATVLISIAKRAIGALSWDFFTKTPATFGQSGGGLEHAFIGSAILVGLATLMALPAGIMIAVYLTEFAHGHIRRLITLVLDVMNGLPTIVIGIFVFGLLVVGHQQSGWAGAVALAIIMLPLIARAVQEVLLLVPPSLREAGLALGAPRWRTVIGVVLPTTLSAIITAGVLAVARAAGETAPLLFTSSIFSTFVATNPSQALPNVPVSIFTLSESPDPADHQRAWAAAFVLILFVLATSLIARAFLARSQRKLR